MVAVFKSYFAKLTYLFAQKDPNDRLFDTSFEDLIHSNIYTTVSEREKASKFIEHIISAFKITDFFLMSRCPLDFYRIQRTKGNMECCTMARYKLNGTLRAILKLERNIKYRIFQEEKEINPSSI